eukprot:PhM_4_TR18430/c0_g1_i1/m.28871
MLSSASATNNPVNEAQPPVPALALLSSLCNDTTTTDSTDTNTAARALLEDARRRLGSDKFVSDVLMPLAVDRLAIHLSGERARVGSMNTDLPQLCRDCIVARALYSQAVMASSSATTTLSPEAHARRVLGVRCPRHGGGHELHNENKRRDDDEASPSISSLMHSQGGRGGSGGGDEHQLTDAIVRLERKKRENDRRAQALLK